MLGSPPHYAPEKYSNAFCCFAEDRNGDGWTDLIVVDFPGTPTWWFENPKDSKSEWKKHLCIPITNNESPTLLDVDGDGLDRERAPPVVEHERGDLVRPQAVLGQPRRAASQGRTAAHLAGQLAEEEGGAAALSRRAQVAEQRA